MPSNYENNNNNLDKKTRTKDILVIIKKIIILCLVLIITLYTSTILLEEYLVDKFHILIVQVVQVSIIGYFVIKIVSDAFYNLTVNSYKDTADSIRILIRIIGTLIVIAFIISYLSQNPILATTIGTVSGLVVGFATQNILGNIISGLYIAGTKQFKIGDKITVFGNTGIIYDIGLIHSKLLSIEGNIVLVPNLSMVSATIIINKQLDK